MTSSNEDAKRQRQHKGGKKSGSHQLEAVENVQMQHISRRKPFRLELIKTPDNIKRRHKPVGRNEPPGAEGLP